MLVGKFSIVFRSKSSSWSYAIFSEKAIRVPQIGSEIKALQKNFEEMSCFLRK